MKKTVLVYRDELLPYSETFIPAQVENFSRYTGFYVGTSRPKSTRLPLPEDRNIVLGDLVKMPGMQRKLFLLTGLGHPSWFHRLKQLSASLIHAHFGPDGVWALPIARELKLPMIVTFHGYDVTMTRYGKLYQLYLSRRKKLFQEAHYCIAVSNFIREKLIESGCPADKILVHYIGINVDKFTPDPNIAREPVVLFVGRLVEKKGCEHLIKAMSLVQKEQPNAELVVIGDGALRSDLEMMAKKSLNNYRFLGAQPPDVVRTWMNKAYMLAVPSVTSSDGDSEGLPIVVMEAEAMNLPVVGSIHAGIPEAVIHGKTGFLAAERDSQALSEYILTLFQNPELREKFANAARKLVEEEFNLKVNSAKLEKIYDRILNESSPSVVKVLQTSK